MSYSNDTEIINPSARTFEWAGKEGIFTSYNKVLTRTDRFSLPFRFIVLDTLSTVGGFSDADQSSYWANDVRFIDKQPLTVRTKKGKVGIGLYKDLKGQLVGLKYCKKLFVAYKDPAADGKLLIAEIKLIGTSNSAFIDYQKEVKICKVVTEIKSFKDGKKGDNKFKIPVFTARTPTNPEEPVISKETDAECIKLDKILQDYLKLYFIGPGLTPEPIQTADDLEAYATTKGHEHLKEASYATSVHETGAPVDTEEQDDLPF